VPDDFGPYTTCYNRFVRWRRAGVWGRIMDALANVGDECRYARMSRPWIVEAATNRPKPKFAWERQPDGTIRSGATFNEIMKQQVRSRERARRYA
jgi:transposase